MNKKFSTLAVGLLLAGAFVNDASAIKVSDAAATGKYYLLPQVVKYQNTPAPGAWTADDQIYWYLQTDADGNACLKKSSNMTDVAKTDAALWKVTAVTGESGYYTLTNKAGKTLSLTVGNAVQSKFFMGDFSSFSGSLPTPATEANYIALDNLGGPQIGFTWTGDATTTTVPMQSVPVSEASATKYLSAFDLVEPTGVAMTADELNAINGATAGFKMQIGDIKNNAYVAYSALEGQVFNGNLKASIDRIDPTIGAPATGYYYLKNGDNYIVLLNEKWSAYNTNHAGNEMGYKLALMSKADLVKQLKRDLAADAGSPKIKTTAFQIAKNVNDGDYLEVAAWDGAKRYELYVADFNGTKYLTVHQSTVAFDAEFNTATAKTYVKFGAGQLVDMKKFIVKDSYYTVVNTKTGETLASDGDGFVSADQVQLDMPEGMWAISYNGSGVATLTNRESLDESSFAINPDNFYYVEGKEDVYEVAGTQYTIKAHAIADLKEGYADFGKTSQKSYTIGVYSPVWKGVAYFAENHVGNHQIGLDTDETNATAWRLEPQADTREVSPITDDVIAATDSVYVISELSYWGKKNDEEDWYTTKDTLKIVSYQIKNAATGEYAHFNSDLLECGKWANNFAFKKVGDSYNMILVTPADFYGPATLAKLSGAKVYGGDSAKDGLLSYVDMYERTENDLIKVEPSDAAIYRRLASELDTISIFRGENASQLLYEDGIFLGLKNENQFDIAPAMLADAAYAPEDTDRPQYLLALNPTIVPAGTYCPVHGANATCEHVQDIPGWVEGRYLVNLKDTAMAFATKPENLHKTNPYVNTEKYYRLGFVQATHKNDTLAIAAAEPTAADSIYVGDDDFNVAKFAFKYVDREAGSFVIETANYYPIDYYDKDLRGKRYKDNTEGYLKWMNGVVVVVPTEAYADVFNLNADEDRNPTANEAVAAAEVSVVAVNGAIIVKGAAGKVVTVANILGQTIANQVAASDNVTIAAPAGIAVVTVDGEATKVVVK